MTATETTATTQAREHVERLFTAEQDLGEKWLALHADLGNAEVTAGDALLASMMGDAKSDTRTHAKVDALQHELKVIENAITTARKRRPDAIMAVWAAEADALEAEAASLVSNADKHQVRTDELLAALQEHEGCRYVAFDPPRETGALVTVVQVPRTNLLRRQAAHLQHRALQARRQTVSVNGSVSADSRADVVSAMRALDPLQLGPALPDAVRCYERLADSEREYRHRTPEHADTYILPDAPVLATVHWLDGQVDIRKSSVTRTSKFRGAYAVLM